MFIQKHTKRGFAISLLILFYLAATLLPARSASAASPAALAAGACATAASEPQIIAASPDAQVTVPKQTVDAAVYAANWVERLQGDAAVELTVQALFLLTGSEPPALATMQEYQSKYQQAVQAAAVVTGTVATRTEIAVVYDLLDTALKMPALAPRVPAVWRALNEGRLPNADALAQPQVVAQSGQALNFNPDLVKILQRNQGGLVGKLVEGVVKELHKCARANTGMAGILDIIVKPQIGAIIADAAKTILAQNPRVSVPVIIRERIQVDGTLKVSLDELKALSEAEFDKLNASIDDMTKTVKDIDERQKVITDYLADQAEQQKMQELAKKKAEEYQLKLDAAKSAISIVSTIAKVINPKVGRQIEVIGASALQVGTAINGWIKAVSGLQAIDKIFSLSSVVMTGNVLGAVMNIVSLFGEPEPDIDQIILEEIGKLRQQVQELRVEMHDRFDRIDQGLNAIYTTMNDRFNQIDIQLGKITVSIVELQQSLLAIDLQLSRIERNNFEFLNVLGRRPLLDAINGGLGYEQRTGSPMPFEPQFVDFENVLHGWGTIHAFDALNAGPTQRDYSDAQVLAELSAYPLDSNINYLNGWLMTHGLPGISNKRLASPRDWIFASRAYTQLGLENPAHMAEIDPARLASLNEVGLELEAAMLSLSTQAGQAGPQGNTLLVSKVITNYENKLDALNTALAAVETNFMNEVRANQLQRAEPFDFHGGVDQDMLFLADGLKQMLHGEPFPPLPVPSNLAARIAELDLFNNAEYFRIDGMQQQMYATMFASHTNLTFPLPDCTTLECPAFGDLTITVRVGYGVTALVLMNYTMPDRQFLGVVDGQRESATAYVARNWPAFVGLVEGAAVDVPFGPVAQEELAKLTARLTKALEERLAGYQHELYARVQSQMSTGLVKPLVNELAGSEALVDAFVTLGLPRAAAGDEFLHAMLFGNQQLVGDTQVRQSYAISASQPITGPALLVNPRSIVEEAGKERAEALRALVDEYIAAITAQTHVEQPDYLSDTRRALDLTVRIARIEAASPVDTGFEKVYLPMVNK